ncbi:hypothetical protein niasHT_029907 [Heterodera trifolii]|uniref:Protein kinase domain-containing protein n=1 Tax=Heterodera trifolii TaxID=157864 RepID=A0ABD2KB69_9BILA
MLIKLFVADGSVLFDNQKKEKIQKNFMVRVKEEDIIYSTDSAAPELLQQLSNGTDKKSEIEVTSKMDIWSAGITIFEITFSEMGGFYSTCHRTVVGELFRSAKLNLDVERPAGNLLLKLKLPEESAHAGSKKWWKRYWVVINDILSAWHKLPEIAFLAVNMLNLDPNERMTTKGVIDYLDGKCKPKYYEKTAEKIALFGNVSVEELRKLMETEGFTEGFNSFLKGPEKEWKNEMEKKEANEKKHEEQIKKMEQQKALKEKEEKKEEKMEKEMKKEMKKEKEEKKEKKKEEAIENLKEKALMKKKNIKEHLANALKSIAGLLEELKERSAICED